MGPNDEFCIYDAFSGTNVPNPNVSTVSTIASCGELGECASNCNVPDFEACSGDCNCGQHTCTV